MSEQKKSSENASAIVKKYEGVLSWVEHENKLYIGGRIWGKSALIVDVTSGEIIKNLSGEINWCTSVTLDLANSRVIFVGSYKTGETYIPDIFYDEDDNTNDYVCDYWEGRTWTVNFDGEILSTWVKPPISWADAYPQKPAPVKEKTAWEKFKDWLVE